MVLDQIESRGVRDRNVLKALRSVPRHLFVPEDLASEAYSDYPLPIGLGQTISQPYIVAFMTELLNVEAGHKVLEIGTGSGYQAAVLSLLAHSVYSIEIVPDLGRQARDLLSQLGYDNVEVRIGNGYLGWPEAAPFDRIIVTAAPDKLPQELVDQLRPGGRLVAPIGAVGGIQQLVLVKKDRSSKIETREVLPVRFVPMVEPPG
jgi:protein-L-isoaspartate(D-aspartate) O-methyltransferase